MALPETDHDILIQVRSDVKHILKKLDGNGEEGLCKQVDRLDRTLTKHDVYFAIMGAVLTVIGVAIAGSLV